MVGLRSPFAWRVALASCSGKLPTRLRDRGGEGLHKRVRQILLTRAWRLRDGSFSGELDETETPPAERPFGPTVGIPSSVQLSFLPSHHNVPDTFYLTFHPCHPSSSS